MNNRAAISRWAQDTLDEIMTMSALNQTNTIKLYLCSASCLKLWSAGRHAALRAHIILKSCQPIFAVTPYL